MGAYMKLGSLEGEATEQGHKKWIIIESMSSPIYRSIAEGAKDQQRSSGTTTLGDVVIVRESDKSSPKLAEACAKGDVQAEAEIHLCTTAGGKDEPRIKIKLENVIISSYSFHGNASGSPVPSEEITLNYSKIEWTYVTLDPDKLTPKGQVVGKYSPGEAKA